MAKVGNIKTSYKSLYLNGSSYLQINNITLGGQDFTIDGWTFINSTTGTNYSCVFAICTVAAQSEGSIFLTYTGNNNAWIRFNGTGFNVKITLDNWFHFTFIYKHGSNFAEVYIDGTKVYSLTTAINRQQYSLVRLGHSSWSGESYLVGYIDEFRISDGIARWTANFTSPARGSISKDSYTKALLKFDESVTKDECGNTWTAYGSPTLSNNAYNIADIYDAKQTSISYKSAQNYYLYLDGSSYLQMNNITLGGQDFTIDFWGYLSSVNGNWARFFSIFDNLNTQSNRIIMGRRSNTKNVFVTLNSDSNNIVTSSDMFDSFNHYALVYQHSAGKFSFYVNGQLIGSKNIQIATHTYSYCWLGYSESTADPMFIGYIDEFRISDGIARWTANFTPPTRGSISKDSYTKALFKFDESVTKDECGNTWTAYGSPTLAADKVLMHFDESATKDECGNTWTAYGSNSTLLCKGAYLLKSDSINMADYQQFTVDLWVYPDGASYGHIIGQHVTIVVGDWYLVEDSNGSFFFSCNSGSFTLRTAVAINAWVHIAMVRNGNNYYLFLNGTLAQSTTWSGAIGNRKVVSIGADCNGNIPFQGYIDDVRISLGIARWTTNFTPPTRGSISKDSYTKALLKFDESATKDECGNTWTAYGSTAQKKFGTSSIYFEGTNYLQSTEGLILKANEKWFISLWNYKTTTSRYDTIMRKAGTRGDWFMFQTSDAYSSGNIGMRFNYNYYSISAGAMPLNAWTHIYVDNDGAGNVSIYVNGVKKASKLINVDFDMSDGIALGGKDYGGTTGYIDELMIGVGRQLYTADFTPPSAPYTAGSADSVVAVDANMMIRHNNANCCIPLTTDKSKTSVPCLSIRHGNINYYAIK